MRQRMGRAVAALGVGCAVIFAVGAADAGASPAASRIAFSVPSVADPIHTWGEPTIGVDPTGGVFVSGPTGTSTQRSVWEGSMDGGQTFPPITPSAPPTSVQSFEDPPGGDTHMDFDHTGKVGG